jgi:hypothetical protein
MHCFKNGSPYENKEQNIKLHSIKIYNFDSKQVFGMAQILKNTEVIIYDWAVW